MAVGILRTLIYKLNFINFVRNYRFIKFIVYLISK
jgi:hypothetical protein